MRDALNIGEMLNWSASWVWKMALDSWTIVGVVVGISSQLLEFVGMSCDRFWGEGMIYWCVCIFAAGLDAVVSAMVGTRDLRWQRGGGGGDKSAGI